MGHPELRIIVERLLEGCRDPEDLHRLFGYLRFRAKGRFPAVKDIGDFQAHWDTRNEGLSYDRAVRFYDMWRVGPFASEFRKAHGLPPPNFEDHAMALRAALDLIRNKIKAYSGFGYAMGKGLLEDILRKALVDEEGKLAFKIRLTHQEIRLWNALISCPKHDETLTQEELIEQFSSCLALEGLLQHDELEAFTQLSDWIAIYALSRMHLVEIVRKDSGQKLGYLEARTSATTERLGVYFNALREPPQLVDARELFTTSCVPAQWCAPELLDIEVRPFVAMANWAFPIRLNSDGKLVPIGEIDEATRNRAAYAREQHALPS
jgi:hypothetical protein